MQKFLVIDNEFNRQFYPELIGKIYETPPSYVLLYCFDDSIQNDLQVLIDEQKQFNKEN